MAIPPTPSLPLSLSLTATRCEVNPGTSHVSVCQYVSLHLTVRLEVRRVTRVFSPFPFRIIPHLPPPSIYPARIWFPIPLKPRADLSNRCISN